jgi:putative ABC transport system substrate-binding protein
MSRRQRRNFLLMAAALAAAPLARAQGKKVPRIGVLAFYDELADTMRGPFVDGLREQGYVEGRDILIEWRSAKGRTELASAVAADFVKQNVDLIVATPTQAVQAAKNATRTIPIVMAPAGDPLGTGFVASLSHPGGNITGLTNIAAELSGKLIELVKELRPGVSRIAVVVQTNNPFSKPFLEQFRSSNVEEVVVAGSADLDAAFAAMAGKRVGAVILTPQLAQKLAADLSLKYRIPSFTTGIATRTFPGLGGLLSYGPNPEDAYRRAAGYVAKILRGAKPADLPIEQPNTFELIVNLKTAKQLGVVVPRSILQRADRVIR